MYISAKENISRQKKASKVRADVGAGLSTESAVFDEAEGNISV